MTTVRPLAVNIGAEIEGVDLTDLADTDVELIADALHRWKVVFFRGQDLDHAAQIAFGRRFGELTYAHPHDDAPPDGYPEIYTVDTRRFEEQYKLDERTREELRASYNNGWHTDVTPAVNPPAGSILRADVVPAYGGDTTFTNLVAAYDALSEPVKALVDGLRAEHYYGANISGGLAASAYLERFAARPLIAHHPVVRVHPETGERALFVNPVFTGRVLDVSPVESRWILNHLFAHLSQPQFTVRFHWEPGSVAFWDNRATAHLGPTDLRDSHTVRVLHRVTLIGDVPVGPTGYESELVAGVPFRSTPVFATA